jgi:hypothetical protein
LVTVVVRVVDRVLGVIRGIWIVVRRQVTPLVFRLDFFIVCRFRFNFFFID